jgi:2-succinyl-6-hydroxy-2,4-cyclohexadiene-1-carboxylate synthase
MGCHLQKVTVVALHGYLGQGSDFNFIKASLPNKFEVITPDLFADSKYDLSSFQAIAEQICNPYFENKSKKIFIGYSLGGRIGLHILEKFPNLFDHFVFLSTHPGLSDAKAQNQRVVSDLVWSQKLTELPWEEYILEWNQQAIFLNSIEPARRESDFLKSQLSSAMQGLSLGRQNCMNDTIQKNNKKISWVVGSRDQKYFDIATDLEQKKILEKFSRIDCGHRVIFDQTLVLTQLVTSLPL